MAHTDAPTALEMINVGQLPPFSTGGTRGSRAARKPTPENTTASPAARAGAVDRLLRDRAELADTHPDRGRLRREAIECALPLTACLARRYAGRGEPIDDLEQVAAIGLVKAVDGFNPQYANNFWAYATPTILGVLRRHFRDQVWAVGVPRRYKELRLEISRCRDEMIQRMHRLPVAAELAEHLGADRKDVTQAIVAGNAYTTGSLYAQLPRDDGATVLIDEVGETEPGYDLVDLSASLRPALARLPHREQYIVTSRFFGNMAQSQIAVELGISQMHVSRLLARALKRLRVILRDAY